MPSDSQRYFLPLLDEHVHLPAGARVVEQGYYDSAAALWAGARAAAVVALRPSIDLAKELEQLALARRMPGIEVRLGGRIEAGEAGSFDATLLLPPFFLGNTPVRQAINTAALALKPDGTLYVQLHKRHGGDTYLRMVSEQFESAELLGMGGGQRRLYAATRPRPVEPADESAPPAPVELSARGQTLQLRLTAGVFASKGVDPGSRLLLQTVAVPPGAVILDVGCGAGPIGLTLAAADRRTRVVLSDVSKAAVDLTRENAALNRLSNVEVRLGDGYDAAGGERYDAIVSNLPAHRGHQEDLSVAERLIAEAPRYLREGGEAWFVATKALPYELPASRAFRSVRRAAEDGRYKVLHCAGPKR